MLLWQRDTDVGVCAGFVSLLVAVGVVMSFDRVVVSLLSGKGGSVRCSPAAVAIGTAIVIFSLLAGVALSVAGDFCSR